MKNKSLNLARAGRAALLLLAAASTLLLLNDIFLYLDGTYILNQSLFITRIIICGISWAGIYSLKDKFNEVKKEKKPLKYGLSLFGSYLFIFTFLSIVILLFGYISGTYNHFDIRSTYEKIENNTLTISEEERITDRQWEAIDNLHSKSSNVQIPSSKKADIKSIYSELKQFQQDDNKEAFNELKDSLTEEEYQAVKDLKDKKDQRAERFKKLKYLYGFLIFLVIKIVYRSYAAHTQSKLIGYDALLYMDGAGQKIEYKGTLAEFGMMIVNTVISVFHNWNYIVIATLQFLPIALVIFLVS